MRIASAISRNNQPKSASIRDYLASRALFETAPPKINARQINALRKLGPTRSSETVEDGSEGHSAAANADFLGALTPGLDQAWVIGVAVYASGHDTSDGEGEIPDQRNRRAGLIEIGRLFAECKERASAMADGSRGWSASSGGKSGRRSNAFVRIVFALGYSSISQSGTRAILGEANAQDNHCCERVRVCLRELRRYA